MEEEASGVLSLRLVLILLMTIPCAVAQGGGLLYSTVERLALLDLRSTLGIRSTDWPIKADPCTNWTGIQCRHGRVTGINISGFRRTRIGRSNASFSVDALSNLTLLESFNASTFRLPGFIPSWFGSRLGSLQVLDLRSSSVSGSIPDSLGNLGRLKELYLSNNGITGAIPSALGQLVGLSVLDLSRNSLTGLVPSRLALLGNLSRLNLSSNFLYGSILPGFGNISRLQFLDVSDNTFSASIPSELGNLSQLLELNVSKNSLSGSLPVELTGLRNLVMIDVGSNELEGQLPDGLFSSFVKLRVVVLRDNKFAGALPGALWSLPSLQVVDLSSNNFTGPLSNSTSTPSANGAVFNFSNNFLYGTLSSSFGNLSLVDLSRNYIEGYFPDTNRRNVIIDRNCVLTMQNQRSLGDCSSFYAERGLNYSGASEPAESPVSAPASKKTKRWIYILVGLLGGVGFIAVLVLVIVVLLRKCDNTTANQIGTANVGPIPEGDSPSPPKDSPVVLAGLGDSFTYEQLVGFTCEFSEANLIKHGHSGDLFRGFMEGGFPVVVKRINLKKESYMMEFDLLSKCSHPRLVPLLGHCLKNESDKFLVYKYMPNGDLASSFYRETNIDEDGLQSLDWITRLKIATGAAEGLAYLHHECNPPLVHRDVQASSILLDDKFEVRLGSLSEVRAQEGDLHHNVLTKFLWKQQSSDPGPSGLSSSSSTCAYDVYCFGMVLLELVTGKLDISKSDDASTKEWLDQTLACISTYDKEPLTKIVDQSLIVDEDLLEEVWAMAIVARSCLNPRPSKRPPMKYILKALENPLKVVREESYNSGRLRTTSSRRSWNAAFFGSWRHSLSENTTSGNLNREALGGSKQPARVGSHGSGGNDHSSSNKRLSSEIFPEPLEMQEEV